MTLPVGERYVKTAYKQHSGTAPQVWHINPDCSSLDGHDVVVLMADDQKRIEDFTGKLLRPCRLCSK